MAETPELVAVFQELADHTRPKCGQCRSPYRCCTSEQCEMTREMAKIDFGVDLADAPDAGHLPFLGKAGCVVPPHQRPLCAVHVCEQHLNDSEWTDKYWELRETAEDLLQRDFPIT